MKIKPSLQTWFGLALLALMVAGSAAVFAANVAPTVVVNNAAQRAGTTFMDIDYRVNDPDDATVQTAALGFVNGGTALSSVLKLNTLVEGTAANIGSNTPANTLKRLTWNVGADWSTNFGNVQIEILAKDGRGLLPFHWITLPSNGPNPEVTINNVPIYDADLLPIWYWLIANNDPAIQLVNGQILGVGGNFASNVLAQGTSTTLNGRWFLWERLSVHSISGVEIARANAGRYGFQSVNGSSVARDFVATPDGIYGWGNRDSNQLYFGLLPFPVTSITAVALGYQHTLVLAEGGVTGCGANGSGQITVPASATNVVAIAAGNYHSLALRGDGMVVSWGYNATGQTNTPASATNVVAIAAGDSHSLALKANGTVVGWGTDNWGQITIPVSVTNVVAIAAGGIHSLALRADGTIVGWGNNDHGRSTSPAGATNVVAIAAGSAHSLALRGDGMVVSWGYNATGQINTPASATNVVAIAAGGSHSLALRADGTIVVWGGNNYGQLNVPAGLSGIDLIGVGCTANHIVAVDKQP